MDSREVERPLPSNHLDADQCDAIRARTFLSGGHCYTLHLPCSCSATPPRRHSLTSPLRYAAGYDSVCAAGRARVVRGQRAACHPGAPLGVCPRRYGSASIGAWQTLGRVQRGRTDATRSRQCGPRGVRVHNRAWAIPTSLPDQLRGVSSTPNLLGKTTHNGCIRHGMHACQPHSIWLFSPSAFNPTCAVDLTL